MSADENVGPVQSNDQLRQLVFDLIDRVEELEATQEDHERRISWNWEDNRDLKETVGELLDETFVPDPADQPTTLQTFAAIPEQARTTLGGSDRRATAIFEHWNEWSREAPRGGVLTTRRDASGKSRLKELLEGVTGESLQWNQVYRAMERVAKLSGGEPDATDDGAFVYHSSLNDPWSESDQSVKALVLERPELLKPGGELE